MAIFPGSLASFAGFVAGHTLAVDNHAAQHNSEQAEIIAVQTKVGTGSSTPSSGQVLRGTGSGASAWGSVVLSTDITGSLPVANAGLVLAAVYPVGCIYTEITGVNPSVTFGFGAWAAYGAGRVLIGNGTSDQAFAAGATGGESNHTLSIAEMPQHNHSIDATGTSGSGGLGYQYDAFTSIPGANTGNAGGGGSHNNLQPYIVVYFWQRTA